MIDRVDTPVLIVGAGPAGLSLAMELGQRGVGAIVVDQLARGGRQPRAKTTNVRSMAHFRRWNLADRVGQGSPLPVDYPRDIIFANRLTGVELARFPNAFFGDQRRRDDRFPEPAQWIPQYKVEAVLRDELATLPEIDLRFGHRLTGIVQTEDGVAATFDCDGRAVTLSSRYLVGADGGRSTTREIIGAQMEGTGAYMRNFLAVYQAPGLAQRISLDPAISYWLVNPDAAAVTGPMDQGDRWFFSTQLKDGTPDYDAEEARRRIALAIGADVPFEILETDTWSAHRLLADRYRAGRVFLAGDACHLHPPMGGYGMNMGIGDAVDLGWKLAAVLQGWGASGLLDSYEQERRPVARLVIDEAVSNYSFVTHHMVRENMEGEDPKSAEVRREIGKSILEGKAREFHAINVVLGLTYQSDIVIADGAPAPDWDPMVYVAKARPGSLAPHLWLRDGSSLYDHFGQGFTLLVHGQPPQKDIDEVSGAASAARIPMAILRLNGEPGLSDLYPTALTLVRPDQHVAWHGDALDRPAGELLAIVTGAGHVAAAVADEMK